MTPDERSILARATREERDRIIRGMGPKELEKLMAIKARQPRPVRRLAAHELDTPPAAALARLLGERRSA